jgi:predicted amidohydrolase
MKIGFVQNAPIFGEIDENYEAVETLTKDVQADLLVLPELFATGYTFISREEAQAMAEPLDGPTAGFLQRLAKKTGAAVVAGFAESENDKVFNSSMLVTETGVIHSYRKIHLFNREKLWFDPGDKALAVHDINGVKIGMMICFDWYFPEVTRTLALLGADVVAHPSNLVLPYCQKAMTTRCLENNVFAITANRIGREVRGEDDFNFTGSSQITAPNGNILEQGEANDVGLGVVEIDPESARSKNLNIHNHTMNDRRPEFYKIINSQ